jgi:diguanylate cyclase (GGDEF)-like protein/PAS domain S-box-containing protein
LLAAATRIGGGQGIDEQMLAELRPVARAWLAQLPGTGLLVADSQLRLRVVEGPAYEEIGWNTEWLDGRLLPQLVPAALWTDLEPHYRHALRGERSDYVYAGPADGRRHWATTAPLRDATGDVVGVVTMSSDVTDRQRASRGEHQRALFEGSPLPLAAADANGLTIRVNRQMCDLLGYDEEELLSRPIYEFAHPADRPAGIAPMCESRESRYVRKDGAIVHVQYSVSTLRDAVGGDDEYIVQLLDDTRRRATLDTLEQRLGEQAVITLLGERALAGLPLESLIAEAVHAAAQVLDVPMAGYGELAPERDSVKMVRTIGWPEGTDGSVIPLAPEVSSAVGEVVLLDDVIHASHADLFEKHGAAAGAMVLVGDPSDPLGILGAHVREPRPFSDAERNFLRAVAHVLASAIARVRADEKARHEALHDALTGLPNRALLRDRIEQGLGRLDGDGAVSLVLLDIDSFKLVNDALGHDAGNHLLCEIAPRLGEVLEPGDTIARVAGDEFALLSVDPDGRRAADRVAEQIRGAFVRPFVLAGEPHFVSASLGVVVANAGSGRGPDELLADADAALHRAKERGRGGYELFDPATRARVVSRLKVETDLRRAIEQDHLRVEYQPYFRLSDGSPAGVEALVRWQHPERGLISPADFIPIAEESGLIAPLGEWVLRRACRDLAEWRAEHDWATGLRMTVNVSARQVEAGDLPAKVDAALRDAGIPAGLLGVEITEGLLLDDSAAPREALAALKRLGVPLLLDDFGTGYSSLSYLSRFPVDVLKVDRSFVRDLGTRADSAPIVTAIVALAEGLRIDVIAEGVETDDQADRLRDMGCDMVQGFLFARPMPAEQLIERLSD